MTKLRINWYPQIPCKPFHIPIQTVAEGTKIMAILADYDQFQYQQKIKPDYANTGTIQIFDPNDHTDSPNGSWIDHNEDDEDDEDDEEDTPTHHSRYTITLLLHQDPTCTEKSRKILEQEMDNTQQQFTYDELINELLNQTNE